MSTVSRMSIRGIRSFGIEKEDEQTIRFTSPLTLIVGANGCGKTTIIECLKYAITGELPPGCYKGQSFIHDPKIYKSLECLGQVKLKINNIIGNSLTCTRSMKTSQTKAGTKFTTMDSTIHFEAHKGANPSTISVKVADATDQMCQAMGVSRAILNNVIFCHQEDSLWPLDEGKKLKEKFDAIFGTTEYNKAVEKFIKQRKLYQDQLKTKNADLKINEHLKKEADHKNLQLDIVKKNHALSEKEYETLNAKIAPIDEKIKKIAEAEHKVIQLNTERFKIVESLKLKKEQQAALRRDIKQIYEGSTEQLKSDLESFKMKMEDNQTKQRDIEKEYFLISNKIDKMQADITKNEGDSKKLIYQREQEQEWNDDRGKKVKELCEKLKISCPQDSESLENVDPIMANVNRQVAKEEKDLDQMKRSYDEEMQKMQENSDKLLEKKASLESRVSAKRNQIKELDQESEKLKKDIGVGESSMSVLNSLITTIESSEKSLEEYTQSSNLGAIRATEVEEKKKRVVLQGKQVALDDEIVFLNSISSITTEIGIKQRDMDKKNSEFTRIKNKHTQNFRTLFPTRSIERNYKANLNSLLEQLQKTQSDFTKQLNDKQYESKSLTQQRKNLNDQLKLKEKELRDSEEQIYEQCQGQEYLDVVAKLKEKSEKLEMDCGILRSSKLMYKRYVSKMTEDPCCPLCHKDMDHSEVGDLTSEIQEKIRSMPRDLENAETLLKNERIKYEKLLSLRFAYENLSKLKEDIVKIKTNLQNIDENYRESLTDAESLEMALIEPKTNLQLIQSMVGDMSILDECVRDLAKKSEDIADLKTKLPVDASSTRTCEEAQSERVTVTAQFKSVDEIIESLQNQYHQISSRIQEERDSLNEMIKQRNSLQEVTQNLGNKRNRFKDIAGIKSNLSTELERETSQIRPLQLELQASMQAKMNFKNESSKKEQLAQENLEKLRSMNKEINRITQEIKKLQELNLKAKITDLSKNHITLNKEKTKLSNENIARAHQITELKSDQANQELNERGLRDNLTLKEYQKIEEEMEANLAVLVEKYGDMDAKGMMNEKSALLKQSETIAASRYTVHGEMIQMNAQIKIATTELNQPKYKSANLNYLKVFYEVTVIKKMIEDLGKYRSALEGALLQYHAQKMEQINRTIRALWTSIYRGNDIDYIQIKTDEKRETNVDKRRTYNYRVVQCKNSDVEIDMRGRCSAGQKVLASLIIRMALAETFSHNCGVLALDEPTTNLDRENISSLCQALCRIVEERQSNQSFMLIIITHDEEFVTSLERVQKYYRLSRSDTGKSVITELRH